MTETEPAGEPPAPDADTVAPRRRFPLAAVLAVLFAAAAVLLAFVATSLKSELDDERADRRAVAGVAGSFSEAILTFDGDDLEATKERVLGLSTGGFAEEFEASFAGLAELVQTASSSARATVDDVFVGDIDGGQATAITVVDLAADGPAGPRTVADTYLRLSLVRVDGDWKVDGVTSLNFAQASAGGDTGAGG